MKNIEIFIEFDSFAFPPVREFKKNDNHSMKLIQELQGNSDY
jgi:hypothetical protein